MAKEVDDLKLIKKHYGEKMMHLCRELFPTLLETPGLLFSLLSKKFDYSRLLYDDIVDSETYDEFKAIIYSEVDVTKGNKPMVTKTPKELLLEKGYDLYECHTEADIQKFRKYYAAGEELCTFQGNRLKRCHVFFAVKKGAERLNRHDFEYPERQDEYGTSVLSIQFTRDLSNTLSIKNRYNHSVNNPDSTFSNNLENIIPGLTEAFNIHYHLHINSNAAKAEIPNYVMAVDGKYYKYNYEFYNIYFCPNNIIIDNFDVKRYPKEKFIILDYFILDLEKKRIIQYPGTYKADGFIESIGTINKCKILADSQTKRKYIIINDERIVIVLDQNNRIISYKNEIVKKIEPGFLADSSYIKELYLPNTKTLDNYFMRFNNSLYYYDLSSVEEIGWYCLNRNNTITEVNFPMVKRIAHHFMSYNRDAISVSMPMVEVIGDEFMSHNIEIDNLYMPNVKQLGNFFLFDNKTLEVFKLLNVEVIGAHCLNENESVMYVYLPKLRLLARYFLYNNENLKSVKMPNLEKECYDNLGSNIIKAMPEFKKEKLINKLKRKKK